MWCFVLASCKCSKFYTEVVYGERILISYVSLCRTSVDGGFKNYIRLAFCHYEPSVLREAASKIGQAVKEMLE